MPHERLTRLTLLPELSLKEIVHGNALVIAKVEKTTPFEVCPKCAKRAFGVYDRRVVRAKDSPLRSKLVILEIVKRRFWCRGCKKPFTEPIEGISKGQRCTRRYRRHLLWACENFTDLKRVKQHMRCSYGFLYNTLYEQLELQSRKRLYPWPKNIGLDEHRFKRHPEKGFPIFASIVVDHVNKRVFDLVEGRSGDELNAALHQIPGRQNVKAITIDLSSSYRSFVRGFFPEARIIADKFHVVRLLNADLNKERKSIAGDRRSNPIGRLLLKNSHKLDFFERSAMYRWLNDHPDLKEIYHAKEGLHGLYRVRGYNRACRAYTAFTDRLGKSKVPAVRRLRRTLISWRTEILEYFRIPLTNGRVEGFNGKAKLIKRKAYGYRSFKNYRLRVLNDCT
jgi:transposase